MHAEIHVAQVLTYGVVFAYYLGTCSYTSIISRFVIVHRLRNIYKEKKSVKFNMGTVFLFEYISSIVG